MQIKAKGHFIFVAHVNMRTVYNTECFLEWEKKDSHTLLVGVKINTIFEQLLAISTKILRGNSFYSHLSFRNTLKGYKYKCIRMYIMVLFEMGRNENFPAALNRKL